MSKKIMIRFASLLVLAIGLTNGQLNFEGNPLTEYTEYTAEESNLAERTTEEKNVPDSVITSRPQKLYPVLKSEAQQHLQQSAETNNVLSKSSLAQNFRSSIKGTTSGRQFQQQFQLSAEKNSLINPAEVALNTFLNSQTPEESRASLDYYLQSQQPSQAQSRSSEMITNQDTRLEQVDIQQQPLSQMEQQQPLLPQINQQQIQLTSRHQVDQSQLMPHDQRQQQLLLSAGQNYGYAGQPASQAMVQPVIRTPTGVLTSGMMQPVPLVSNFQGRNDMMTSAMWRQRMRRIRGKPFPYAQARIAPGLYKGPIAVPIKHHAPVEVIYTKPPGFHRGPPILSNPPVPYEDAGAWFPDVDYPPSSKDVYYSQLYAQSYDPHYYNYIAASGKIRPHLYGKLGKYKEEKDDGIWTELYRGFTKHGLKNIMTPTFLLGMTLPVVTLMLSALVQKRSIARSDARELDQEDALREYLERLQKAMECYGARSSRDAKSDDC